MTALSTRDALAEAEFHVEQLRDALDRAERKVERAERLLDGWEHDGPDDAVMLLLIRRMREALTGGPSAEQGHIEMCGSATLPDGREVPGCWVEPDDDCDHEWLDRPESDTRECLICGTEVAG